MRTARTFGCASVRECHPSQRPVGARDCATLAVVKAPLTRALVLPAVVLLVSGCGGTSGSNSASFSAAANGACRTYIRGLGRPGPKPTARQSIRAQARDIRARTKLIAALSSSEAPESIRTKVAQLIASLRRLNAFEALSIKETAKGYPLDYLPGYDATVERLKTVASSLYLPACAAAARD